MGKPFFRPFVSWVQAGCQEIFPGFPPRAFRLKAFDASTQSFRWPSARKHRTSCIWRKVASSHRNFFNIHTGHFGWIQLAGQIALGFLQLSQELGRNGQQVTARQFCNFANVAKSWPPSPRFVAELLVVVIDLGHREHAGVFLWGDNSSRTGGFLVTSPECAPQKGETQRHRSRPGNRLPPGAGQTASVRLQ